MDKEEQISFHIMLLTAFTVLCLLLDVVIAVSGWGNTAILLVTGSMLLCWLVHFRKLGGDDRRLYFYVAVMLLILGYYAFQGSTITDVPIILCLLIIMLSKKNDKRLIYIVTASYLVYLAENLIFADFLRPGMEQIVFSRLALGIVCLLSACMISTYFIRQYENLEQELLNTREKLLLAQKENELFLSNMSHELRTPINAVNGVSELLLAGKFSKGDRDKLRVIRNAGRRLYRQVSDVLDYSEIETGHFSLTYDEYEPVSVVYDVVNMIGETGRGNELAVDIEASLPKTLYGDVERIKKLLFILVDNALKFTEEGGIYIFVHSRKEEYGINLNIDLWDTGCGIPEDELKKLFKGSYLGDNSAERKKGGLGLGLAIAHGITSAMKGFLSIESKVGEGTHVRVSIPQEVRSESPSLSVDNIEKYKIVCYINREKYARQEVGDFYHTYIEHMRSDFGLDISFAASLQEVKELCGTGLVTHLYIAVWEYRMEPEYFDRLADEITVCIFADAGFTLNPGSHVDIVYKPIYAFAVLNHLRNTLPGSEREEYPVQKEISFKRKGYRALVVDDEEMNLVVAKGLLEEIGISTDICSSGMAAIEKCGIADYDIIFMDYMMPGVNGVTAMQKLRNIRNGYYRDKPIVVFTANAVSGAKERFLKEGFDEFISKPIELKNLRKILEKYLTGGRE